MFDFGQKMAKSHESAPSKRLEGNDPPSTPSIHFEAVDHANSAHYLLFTFAESASAWRPTTAPKHGKMVKSHRSPPSKRLEGNAPPSIPRIHCEAVDHADSVHYFSFTSVASASAWQPITASDTSLYTVRQNTPKSFIF